MASFNRMRLGLNPYPPAPFIYYQIGGGNWSMHFSQYDKTEIMFQAEEACSITAIGLNGHSSGTSPPTFEISLQGIDATTGLADGNKMGSGEVVFPDQSNFVWIGIDEVSVSRGERLSIVLEYKSGTISLSNGAYVNYSLLGSSFGRAHFPYAAWIQQSGTRLDRDRPIYGYKSASKSYGLPLSNANIVTFNYPAQQGISFAFPEEFGDVFRVAGVRWQGSPQSTPEHQYDMILYEGNTIKQRKRVESDQGSDDNYVRNAWVSEVYFDEDALADLYFGNEYIIAFQPVTDTTGFQLQTLDFPSGQDAAALPGGGIFGFASRDGSSDNWTYDSSRRPVMDLILDWWGRPPDPQIGTHLKFSPKYNSSLFIEHADDAINDVEVDSDAEDEPHEGARTIIGNAIKSYGGYKTVEVFKDPDTDCSIETRLYEERPIEQLKVIGWEGMEAGLYRILFRFRTETASEHYVDFEQWLRIVVDAE